MLKIFFCIFSGKLINPNGSSELIFIGISEQKERYARCHWRIKRCSYRSETDPEKDIQHCYWWNKCKYRRTKQLMVAVGKRSKSCWFKNTIVKNLVCSTSCGTSMEKYGSNSSRNKQYCGNSIKRIHIFPLFCSTLSKVEKDRFRKQFKTTEHTKNFRNSMESIYVYTSAQRYSFVESIGPIFRDKQK